MEGVMLWGRTCLFLLSKGNVAALEAFEDGEKRQNNINMQIEGAREGCWLGEKRGYVFMDCRNAVWYFH